MWKAVLAGTAAVAIAGGSLVYAQQRGRPGGFEFGWQPTLEDMRLFDDARLAALHAGLGLNGDQEKSWPAFEEASHEFAKLRLDRISGALNLRRDRGPQSDDPAERMQQRAAAMTETGAALKKLADATGPLFRSLDEAQKRRFTILERMLTPRQAGSDWPRRDGRDGDRPRRPDFGPRRTDFTPQGGEQAL
jgi:zinc resistance-associated protein